MKNFFSAENRLIGFAGPAGEQPNQKKAPESAATPEAGADQAKALEQKTTQLESKIAQIRSGTAALKPDEIKQWETFVNDKIDEINKLSGENQVQAIQAIDKCLSGLDTILKYQGSQQMSVVRNGNDVTVSIPLVRGSEPVQLCAVEGNGNRTISFMKQDANGWHWNISAAPDSGVKALVTFANGTKSTFDISKNGTFNVTQNQGVNFNTKSINKPQPKKEEAKNEESKKEAVKEKPVDSTEQNKKEAPKTEVESPKKTARPAKAPDSAAKGPMEDTDDVSAMAKETDKALGGLAEARAQVEVKSDYSKPKIEAWVKAIDAYLTPAGREIMTRAGLGMTGKNNRLENLNKEFNAQTAKRADLVKTYLLDTTPTKSATAPKVAEKPKGAPDKKTVAKNASETKESSETPEQRYERVKNEQRMKRDTVDKYNEADTDWNSLENGKMDFDKQNPKPYLYKKGTLEGKPVLLAYSKVGGLQVMDKETGVWRFSKDLNPKEKAELQKDESDVAKRYDGISAAEAKGEKYADRLKRNQRNHDMEEQCLRNGSADSKWFTVNKGKDMWTQNEEVRKALEDALKGKDTGPIAKNEPKKGPTIKPVSQTKPGNAAPDKPNTTTTDADKGKPNEKPAEQTDLQKENAELRRQISELVKKIAELTKRIEQLEKAKDGTAKGPDAAEGDKPKAGPEKPKSTTERKETLAKEIDGLKGERAKIDVDWKATIGQGYDALHKDNDAGFKKLDQMEARAKELDTLIAQKEAELKALNENKEAPTEDVDQLLAKRSELNKELTGLGMGQADKVKDIKVKIEVIDAKLKTIRSDLNTQLTKLPIGSTKERQDLSTKIAKIDAVIPPEAGNGDKKPDGKVADKNDKKKESEKKLSPEEERLAKLTSSLRNVAQDLGNGFRKGNRELPAGKLDSLDGVKQYLVDVLGAAKNVSGIPIYLQDGNIYVKQSFLWMDRLNSDGLLSREFTSKLMADPAAAFKELAALASSSSECSATDKEFISKLVAHITGTAGDERAVPVEKPKQQT